MFDRAPKCKAHVDTKPAKKEPYALIGAVSSPFFEEMALYYRCWALAEVAAQRDTLGDQKPTAKGQIRPSRGEQAN